MTAPATDTSRPPVSLESTLADLIDDPEAFAATMAAVADVDPAKAEDVRRHTAWLPGRQVKELFDNRIPPAARELVVAAFEQLNASRTALTVCSGSGVHRNRADAVPVRPEGQAAAAARVSKRAARPSPARTAAVSTQQLRRRRAVGELVQGRIDPDQGELALDEREVGAPDVDEDPTQVRRVVVPALAR